MVVLSLERKAELSGSHMKDREGEELGVEWTGCANVRVWSTLVRHVWSWDIEPDDGYGMAKPIAVRERVRRVW